MREPTRAARGRSATTGILVACLVLVGLVAGCDWDTHAGEYQSEDRKVAAFDRIKVNGRTDVTIKQGGQQTLSLRGGAELLKRTNTTVSGGTLTIDRVGRAGRSMDITIVVPRLRGVDVDGAGKVELTKVDTDTLDVRKGGAGELVGEGRVNRLNATLSGVGGMDLARLVAKTADVKVSGVGHAVVNVTDDLTATVNGVGGVEYHGNPNVHPNLNGVGDIRRA